MQTGFGINGLGEKEASTNWRGRLERQNLGQLARRRLLLLIALAPSSLSALRLRGAFGPPNAQAGRTE